MNTNAGLTGRDELKSTLVRALEQWTTPYDIRPDGVYGSVATIQCGGVTLSSNDLDIEFSVPFDDDMEPNEADIIIYNLTDNTIKQLGLNAQITIEAGYEDDTGVIFSGYITKVKTSRDGADRVTQISAMDDIRKHTVESISFSAGTRASYILKALINKTGLPVAVFSPRRDHTYKDAQTVDGDLMEAIHRYATVCGVSVYVNKGKVYARYIKEGDALNFTLSAATGLIDSPSAYTEEISAEDYTETVNGYECSMLLQHRMSAGAIVKLDSLDAQGQYRVCSGEHRFDTYEATTSIKMY